MSFIYELKTNPSGFHDLVPHKVRKEYPGFYVLESGKSVFKDYTRDENFFWNESDIRTEIGRIDDHNYSLLQSMNNEYDQIFEGSWITLDDCQTAFILAMSDL